MELANQAVQQAVETNARFEPRLGRSVSIDQAAVLLGVSRRTIYNRIRDHKLETIRTLGTSQRVLITSIDEARRAVWDRVQPVVPPPPPRRVVLPFVRPRVSL